MNRRTFLSKLGLGLSIPVVEPQLGLLDKIWNWFKPNKYILDI